jgi:putative flippase GtrA
VSSYALNRRWTWRHRAGRGIAVGLPAFVAVALLGVAVAETCLLTSHYLLGLTSTLSDNLSANVVGLLLGMAVRYRLCDRWVFRADEDVVLDLTRTGAAADAERVTPVPTRRAS